MIQFSRTLPLLPVLAMAAAAAAQEHDLRTTAKKGTVAHFLQTHKQEQAIDMGGQSMDMGNTVHYALKLAVTDVAENGNLAVEVEVLRVHGMLILPMMGEVEFDSTSGPAEDDGFGMGALGDAMTSLAGKKFTATVSPYGKVSALVGADKLLEAAREKGGSMGQMLAGSLRDDTLESLVTNAFGLITDKPIAVGKSWDSAEKEKASRAPVENKMTMTLLSFGDETFEIEAKGTVEQIADGKGPEVEGLEGDEAEMAKEMMKGMKIKNGKIAGKQKISRQDGLTVEANSSISVDIEMPNPMGGDPMTIASKTITTTKRCTAEEAMPKKKAEAKDAKADGADKK